MDDSGKRLSKAWLEALKHTTVNESMEKVVESARKAIAENVIVSTDLQEQLKKSAQIARKERDDFLRRSIERLMKQLDKANDQIANLTKELSAMEGRNLEVLADIKEKLEHSRKMAKWYFAAGAVFGAAVSNLEWIFSTARLFISWAF